MITNQRGLTQLIDCTIWNYHFDAPFRAPLDNFKDCRSHLRKILAHRHVQANLARQNRQHENVTLCDDCGLEYLSVSFSEFTSFLRTFSMD
jgi:hypothetical protein